MSVPVWARDKSEKGKSPSRTRGHHREEPNPWPYIPGAGEPIPMCP